ncbi:unnamed protein product [Prunus brigantina]
MSCWFARRFIGSKELRLLAWLRDGVRNTRFFHQRANMGKQRNNIHGLTDRNGDFLLNTVEPCVTQTMNDSLLTSFTEQEVKHAVFQMYPTKAPGPDGMPPVFFQKYWHIVGNDVSRAIINFLSSGRLLHKINFTHVVLANRLKSILPSLISPSQSAFVSGRLISDNSILAAEIIHCLRSRRRGKKGFLALKLDMSKAYDRIEWPFLEEMMKKLGFAEQWGSQAGRSAVTLSVYFMCTSKNVKRQDQLVLAASLGFSCVEHYDKYLGLPMISGGTEIMATGKYIGLLGISFANPKILGGWASQGWRLIQYPDSLIARVLRAKYFPDKSFLDVPVSDNSSYVWKSICAARKILLQGSRWQVGSGAEIDIWKDPWLPRRSTFRVISPKPTGCAVTKVKELILDHPRRWNISLLSNLLYPPDVDVARTVLDPKTVASSSTGNGFSRGWTAIWKAKIPSKIKLGVWACALIGSGGISQQYHHVHDWVLSRIDHLSYADLDLFFVTGWAIWEARNGKLWNNQTPKPEFTSSSAAVRLLDFVRARPQGAALGHGCSAPQPWTKPCTGSLKINVDGSWTAGNTYGGVGIVVRDSNGRFVAGRALHVENVFSALQSDSLQIVSAIRSSSVDRSNVGPVVEDTKALLTQITGDGFTHIRWVANGAAHRLARYASHIGTMTTWFEEPPDLLVDVLYEECNL